MLIWSMIVWLACAAIFLELVERAPSIDNWSLGRRAGGLAGRRRMPGGPSRGRSTHERRDPRDVNSAGPASLVACGKCAVAWRPEPACSPRRPASSARHREASRG